MAGRVGERGILAVEAYTHISNHRNISLHPGGANMSHGVSN